MSKLRGCNFMVNLNQRSKLEKLKSLPKDVDWDNKQAREDYLARFCETISQWKGCYPNLRDIFQPEEIDRLIEEVMKKDYHLWRNIIDFVLRCGYRDKPPTIRDENNGNKPAQLYSRSTPVHMAARKAKYNSSMCHLVPMLFKIYNKLDTNYVDDGGLTHFHAACMFGCGGVVKTFIEKGQDPNCLCLETGESPLFLALNRGHYQVVELLLKKGADPNSPNKHGWTLLHAISNNHTNHNLVKMVLKHTRSKYKPVQLDAQDKQGNTALHVALKQGHAKTAQVLLRSGAEPNVANDAGATPLHVICQRRKENDSHDLARLFFQTCDATGRRVLINARDVTGDTPLHATVRDIRKNYCIRTLIGLLLERGADPNAANEADETPLHVICRIDELHLDWILAAAYFKRARELELELVIDARDRRGDTALHLAVARRRENLFDLLLRNGADPSPANEQGQTPLHLVCEQYSDHGDLVKSFLRINEELHRPVAVNAQDKLGNTPLHWVLARGHQRVMKYLMKYGVDTTLANAEGSTPLHYIAKQKKLFDYNTLAIFLNDAGQRIDARDCWGDSPLHLAIRASNERMIEVLLNRGANTTRANDKGETPLHAISKRIELQKSPYLAAFLGDDVKDKDKLQLIDARDGAGYTPLHWAVKAANWVMIEALLRRGADPNSANDEGETPLHTMCKRDYCLITMSNFIEMSRRLGKPVQLDVQDTRGRTPLQLAVANLRLGAIRVLARDRDLAKFVFPAEADLLRFDGKFPTKYFSLGLASMAMICLERLESSGYELDLQGATTLLKWFDRHGLFRKTEHLDQRRTIFEWSHTDCAFMREARDVTLKEAYDGVVHSPALSLYDWLQLPEAEAERRFSYLDYLKFIASRGIRKLSPRYRETCDARLFEVLSRRFFRCWAIVIFMGLTRWRLPFENCETIIDRLSSRDRWNICSLAGRID